MSKLTYEEVKTNVKGIEENFYDKSKEARHQCDLLIDGYFEKMKSDICEVVKDFSRSDLGNFLHDAAKDEDIDAKLGALMYACWVDTHNKRETHVKDDADILDIIFLASFVEGLR